MEHSDSPYNDELAHLERHMVKIPKIVYRQADILDREYRRKRLEANPSQDQALDSLRVTPEKIGPGIA